MGIVDGIRIGNKVGYMNTSRHGKNNVLGGTYHINGEARLLIHAQKEGKGKLQKHDELLLGESTYFVRTSSMQHMDRTDCLHMPETSRTRLRCEFRK